MDLILFGMQGSGKGTQSKFIAESCNLTIFETGAALRSLAAGDSELGKKIKGIIESGKLVSTEVVMEIISDFIEKLPEGQSAIFDGIPRSKEQQVELDKLLTAKNRKFIGLNIKISEEEALRRLTTRRICSKCKATYPAFYDKETCEACDGELIVRRDDTPDAIRVRIDTFLEKTIPVIEDYTSREKMININGEQSIEKVLEDSISELKDHFTCL